jgi:hypothetical protein
MHSRKPKSVTSKQINPRAYNHTEEMTTDRRFARFNAGKSTASGKPDTSKLTSREVLEGGMCLSVFVVLTGAGSPNQVLLGRLNPEARWDTSARSTPRESKRTPRDG